VLRQYPDIPQQRRSFPRKAKRGQGRMAEAADSFDPADTHHAGSSECRPNRYFYT